MTLRDQIARLISDHESGIPYDAAVEPIEWSKRAAEAVLALLAAEGEPSDEDLDRMLALHGYGLHQFDAERAIWRDGSARGLARGERERAELQRRLDEALDQEQNTSNERDSLRARLETTQSQAETVADQYARLEAKNTELRAELDRVKASQYRAAIAWLRETAADWNYHGNAADRIEKHLAAQSPAAQTEPPYHTESAAHERLGRWLVLGNFRGYVPCHDCTGDVPEAESWSVKLWHDSRARKHSGKVTGPGRANLADAINAALDMAEAQSTGGKGAP